MTLRQAIPAAARARQGAWTAKLTELRRLRGRGDRCGLPHQAGEQERQRDHAGGAVERDAGTVELVREPGENGRDHAGDAAEGLLYAEHQPELVAVRVVADEGGIGREEQRGPEWQQSLEAEKERHGRGAGDQQIAERV